MRPFVKLAFAGIFVAIVMMAAGGIAGRVNAAASERIAFGPPGPRQTIAFGDRVVSAAVTFRESHDMRYDRGPAALGPSISSGRLTLRAFGKRRSYELAALLPLVTNHVDLSVAPSCGAATALSRRGSYLAIEAVLGEKGCAAFATFVDLRGGSVVKEAVFDAAWLHRFDTRPYHATGEPIRIVHAERIAIEAVRLNARGTSVGSVAWPFLIVHASDAHGALLPFAIDLAFEPIANRPSLALRPGDDALVGTTDIGDPLTVSRLFEGERFIRPGVSAEARLDALQSPAE